MPLKCTDVPNASLSTDLPRQPRLIEEAVVEDHRRLHADAVRGMEHLSGVEEVLLHDIGLAVPRRQGFFEEEPLRLERQQRIGRVEAVRLFGEDEAGVRLVRHQVGRVRRDAPAETLCHRLRLAARAIQVAELDILALCDVGQVVLLGNAAGSNNCDFHCHPVISVRSCPPLSAQKREHNLIRFLRPT